MKHFFAVLLAAGLSLVSASVSAQTMPPLPPASLSGQALRDWLRQNWYDGKRVELSYSAARGKMYNYADNYNGKVRCVYSGYEETVRLDSSSTSTGVVSRINCEHTIPQSWFNEVVRMRSDMHHLFPTYDTWNSNRGSDPFAEIPDTQTTLWMRNTQSQTSIPAASIRDEFSEDTNTQFEPREDHKGNLARAAFYFYTMHQNQSFDPGKGVISALADMNTLYQWHLADPVDAHERERNRRVAKSQGNFNPYIADPGLVARAWGFAPPGPTVSFAAVAGSITEGNSGTSTYTATLNISPAPTSTLTVQVAVDAANSTASNPSDYTFSTQTLTFAAGQTTATVSVTVNGDTQPELDETVRLMLQNPATGLLLGSPMTHDLTILNDDGQPPVLAFRTASAAVPEGNSGTSTYTVDVLLTGATPSGPFTVPVSVDPTSTADAADFTLNTTSLSFAAGQNTATVTVTVIGDTQPEPNETVGLRLGQPSAADVLLGAPATHILTILNDDQPAAGAPCSKPFFSEYVESSVGNTKVLEIYNPLPTPLNLSGYQVRLYANGATTPTSTLNMTGTVAAGGVYIISTPDADATVLAKANVTNSPVVFFNGDDAIGLFQGTDTLDVIGVIGQRPATGWAVAGGGTTTDNTLVRRDNVSIGQARWANASAGWEAKGVNVFGNLGRHVSNDCALVTATTKAAALRTGLTVFPNPGRDDVRLRLDGLTTRQLADVSVTDGLGRVVRRSQQALTPGQDAVLDVRGLPAGLYFVTVDVAGARYASRLAVQP